MQRAAAGNFVVHSPTQACRGRFGPHRADVDLRNQCSYATLDVDDPESSDSAGVAGAAISMRIELE
jgi:hypothetical protein